MAGKRKSHSAAFKAQVALAAVKGDRTINELASHYGGHPTLIHAWKKQLLAGAEAVFASGAKAAGAPEDKTAELYLTGASEFPFSILGTHPINYGSLFFAY